MAKQIPDFNRMESLRKELGFQENGFRKTAYSVDEILDDVTALAFKYSQSLLKGADNSFPEIALINDGLNKVGNHLRQKINRKYSVNTYCLMDNVSENRAHLRGAFFTHLVGVKEPKIPLLIKVLR